MTPSGPDHKLAQALDLARREAALTTAELADALSFNPRTVRRYLNGERRPQRDTVVRWEQACQATPGTLTALYDGSPASDAPRTRFSLRSVAATAVAVAVVLGAVLLLRGDEHSNLGEAAQGHATSVAYHRFTTSYVGDVWIRIAPAPGHTGALHRVTLRWGQFVQEVDLNNLVHSRQLFTAKTRADRVPIRVSVTPSASIAFGETTAPADALDINQGWKKGRVGRQPRRSLVRSLPAGAKSEGRR
jgi:transcriptional regulator with XRE-family HTH domain